jgi:hypothetical protein
MEVNRFMSCMMNGGQMVCSSRTLIHTHTLGLSMPYLQIGHLKSVMVSTQGWYKYIMPQNGLGGQQQDSTQRTTTNDAKRPQQPDPHILNGCWYSCLEATDGRNGEDGKQWGRMGVQCDTTWVKR